MWQTVGRCKGADTAGGPTAFVSKSHAAICRISRASVAVSAEFETDSPPEVGWLWDSSVSRTKAQLKSINARPKKALGQNFVTDQNVLSNVVEKSGIGPGDLVLEIGPGTGNLTRNLLKAGATVLAVEKDYVLADKLKDDLEDTATFKIIQGDILRLNIAECIADAQSLQGEDAPKRIKVVANLPYYITTDLLKQLLSKGDMIESLSFLLQDEVAERLTCEHPDVGAYRPMTVFAHFYGTPQYVFKIDRSCFYPVPNVHGALATFSLLPPSEWPQVRDEREFLVFVRQAFLSKRKMLTNSLQPMWSRETVAAALQAMGLSEQVRPTDISSREYVNLYNAVCASESTSGST
eukprot:jgi/Ulvmu1/12846/UM098_0031.1